MKAVGLAVIRMKAVVLEMVYWMSYYVYRSRGGGLLHTCMQALIIYRIRLNNHRIKDFIILHISRKELVRISSGQLVQSDGKAELLVEGQEI